MRVPMSFIPAMLMASVLVGAVSTTALAEEPDFRPLASLEGATDEARMHFDLGSRYYRTGRYAAAAREFRASFELTGLTDLLYNMYLAYQGADDIPAAIDSLARYVSATDNDARRRAAVVRLEQLRASVEANPPETSPPDTTEEASEVDVASMEEPDPPLEPETEVAPSPSPAPWIVLGAGAALALASIIPGALALSDDGELDDLCATGTCTGNYVEVQDRGRRRAATSDVMLFTGLAVATGGLLWGLLRRDPAPDTAVSTACAPTGCTAALRHRF